MASIATVVTRGFGSFGSVDLLPTLGYGIGSAVLPSPEIVMELPRRTLSFNSPHRSPIINLDSRTARFTLPDDR